MTRPEVQWDERVEPLALQWAVFIGALVLLVLAGFVLL
jgi:hypothetical protein